MACTADQEDRERMAREVAEEIHRETFDACQCEVGGGRCRSCRERVERTVRLIERVREQTIRAQPDRVAVCLYCAKVIEHPDPSERARLAVAHEADCDKSPMHSLRAQLSEAEDRRSETVAMCEQLQTQLSAARAEIHARGIELGVVEVARQKAEAKLSEARAELEKYTIERKRLSELLSLAEHDAAEWSTIANRKNDLLAEAQQRVELAKELLFGYSSKCTDCNSTEGCEQCQKVRKFLKE